MSDQLHEAEERLLSHARLFTRKEILSKPCPVPQSPGVYAWFFKAVPPGVPTDGCIAREELTLLYVGISPKADPKVGKPSRQTLRTRVRYHLRGNAEGSTLRLSLGCLLAENLGIELRRVGSGKRMTFTAPGEDALSTWMNENASVTWVEYHEPWELEAHLIKSLSLPLNLADNDHHPFRKELGAVCSKGRERAKELPISVR